MSFFRKIFGMKSPEPAGFVNLDFESTFPHVFWTSDWRQDSTYPHGFRYKVLSIRHEPKGEFEVVLIQELHNGEKTQMQRWSVPPDAFDTSEEMIGMLEEQFDVHFDRVDMSHIRTFEEFEARSIQSGWNVP